MRIARLLVCVLALPACANVQASETTGAANSATVGVHDQPVANRALRSGGAWSWTVGGPETSGFGYEVLGSSVCRKAEAADGDLKWRIYAFSPGDGDKCATHTDGDRDDKKFGACKGSLTPRLPKKLK